MKYAKYDSNFKIYIITSSNGFIRSLFYFTRNYKVIQMPQVPNPSYDEHILKVQ